jgi:molecular chaperone HtpG
MLNFLTAFEGKSLQSVAKGTLDLGKLADEDLAPSKAVEEEFKGIVGQAKVVLGDKVKDVRITRRLTDSACCLVSDDDDVSGHLERLLKQAGQKAPDRKPILELNPDHPLVKALSEGSETFSDLVWLLFDQALLAEGGQPEDPAGFVRRLNRFLLRGLMA